MNRIFNMQAATDAQPPVAPQPPTNDAGDPGLGVINSSQAVITFAGAPTAVIIVWKVLAAVFPSWGNDKLVPLVLSLVVGMLIYFGSAEGSGTGGKKWLGACFALINSFAIAATALGIDVASNSAGAGNKPSVQQSDVSGANGT